MLRKCTITILSCKRKTYCEHYRPTEPISKYIPAKLTDPANIHGDNASSFRSEELKQYLLAHVVASSYPSPFNPRETAKLKDADYEMEKCARSLSRMQPRISVHGTPHDRMFQYRRRNIPVKPLPVWLKNGETWCQSTYEKPTNPSYSLVEDPDSRSRVVSSKDISKYEKFEDEDCDLEKESDISYHNTYADEFFDNRQEKYYERQNETKQSTPK
ncbi:hypothetical protein GJ496_007131 [Pomphorhynchus laevis]|nr:hypothetical protein GJ496_007131 [Pomphorhynchus laevis]